MFITPTAIYQQVVAMVSGLFGDLSPIIVLIGGIMLGFFVFEMLIGWAQQISIRGAARREGEESILESAYKTLKLKKPQIEKIGKKDKATQQAIILRARFKDLMAEK